VRALPEGGFGSASADGFAAPAVRGAWWRGLVVPAGLVAVWGAVAAWPGMDALFVPTPWAVGGALVQGVRDGSLPSHATATLARALGGFAIAFLLGAPLGVAIGRWRAVAALLEPLVDVLRAIPPTALLPLFTLLFALGDATKLALVVYGCTFVVLVNAAYGARQVSRTRLDATRLLGLSAWQQLRWVVVPEAGPALAAGARVGISLALMLVVVSEMFAGTSRGLGAAIAEAGSRYAMPACWAAIAVTGLVGWAASGVVRVAERRVLHWVGG
jgi:ABC-type nitrate/sulfonate/bicarbonate transport system permease component